MTRLLITDDEPEMCILLLQLLEKEGFEVITTHHGKEAIDAIAKNPVDLMLLDMRLPDMDGIDILQAVRKIKKDLPVIILSGYSDLDAVVDSVKLGAVEYVSKPFRRDELISKIKKALRDVKIKEKENFIVEELVERLEETAPGESAVSRPGIKKKSSLLKIASVFILLAIGVLFLWLKPFQKPWQDITFHVQYKYPTAVSFYGKYLWTCDWFSQTVYKHNVDEFLSLAGSFLFKDVHPMGMAVSGENLWICDSWTRKIHKHSLDVQLSMIKSYESPGPNPSGLCWDGLTLWSCDASDKKIYRHNLDETLSVANVYPSPGPNPVGIFFDGKNLWSCDGDKGEIYRHANDPFLSVERVYQPAEYGGPNALKLSGMTYDGRDIWTCAEGGIK